MSSLPEDVSIGYYRSAALPEIKPAPRTRPPARLRRVPYPEEVRRLGSIKTARNTTGLPPATLALHERVFPIGKAWYKHRKKGYSKGRRK